MLLNRKMITVVLLLVALVLLVVAIPVATADHPDIEPHPHMLLLNLEFADGEPVGFEKCVDLAGNRPVPNHAHHEQLHFGDAGISFGGEAGHAVIPAGWFPNPHHPLPWADCADFEAIFAGQ
ncbi:MAG: hypothetical protein R3300_07335 [Candidatus Promineifilaceae bacterium]|nr:hypothetical protein [Candidatus Promineifilaceae bacterium]